MTNGEKCDAIVIAVVAITIALVAAAASRSLAVVGLSLSPRASFVWYARLRVFDVTTEVLALGVVAYVLPRTARTAFAARLAAALAVVAIAAEAGEWLLEGGNRFLASEGGAVASGLAHVREFTALAAVVVLWYAAEHRGASGEVAAPDLS